MIDLSLPAKNSGVEQLKVDNLQLEVVLRPDSLEVGDRLGGLIQRIPNTAKGYDTAALSTLIQQVKAKFPDKMDASVLAEPNTSYDALVQVMDAVRVVRHAQGPDAVADRTVPQHLDRRCAGRQAIGAGAMALMTPLQKRAERRARNQTGLDMNLVSLIDVFTILIFFLLSNATGVELLPSPKAVQLPQSTAEKEPRQNVVLVVSGTEILVEAQGRERGRGDGAAGRPDLHAEG